MESSLTVVVPAFREGQTIFRSTSRLVELLDREFNDFRIVVVLDGPDRFARDELARVADNRLSVIELQENLGKGAALRIGCVGISSEFVAFMDADLDIHPQSLVDCFKILSRCDSQTVCSYGSKFHPESRVDYPMTRRIASRAFYHLIRFLFELECRDTQTGVKLFKGSYLMEVINLTQENRFLFDIELLASIRARGWKFVEAPVQLSYNYSSTINVRAVMGMLRDTFALRFRLNRVRGSESC